MLKNEDLWGNMMEAEADKILQKLRATIALMRNAIKFAEAEYFKLVKNGTGVMFNKKRPMISESTSLDFNKKP